MTQAIVTIESSGVVYELRGQFNPGHPGTREDPSDPPEYWVEEIYLIPKGQLRVPEGSPNLIPLIEAIDGQDMIDDIFYAQLSEASEIAEAASYHQGDQE